MEERNQRPKEGSNIPAITLGVLVAVIALMLYVGWESMSDNSDTKELSHVRMIDSLSNAPTEVADSIEIPLEPLPPAEKKNIALKEGEPREEQNKEKIKEKEESPKDNTKNKSTYITHTVAAGQTFFGIANRYNLRWQALKELNPDVNPENVKVGITKLKVKIKAKHTVSEGDVLRVIAQKYGVSKELIMQANGKTKDITQQGEVLIIPFPEKQ